jgi:hypothetical protein
MGNPFLSGPLPVNLSGGSPGLTAIELQGAPGGNSSSLGPIPADWGQGPLLKRLWLAKATLDGGLNLPTDVVLEDLPGLAAIHAAAGWQAHATNCRCTSLPSPGTLPSSLGPVLEELRLSNVNFTSPNALPSGWSGAGALRRLLFEGVGGLTGTVPTTWATGMPAIDTISFDGVSGLNSALASFAGMVSAPGHSTAPAANLTGVAFVKLAGMGLTGPVPETFFQSPRLAHLNLSANTLTGVLGGAAWANASALRVLDLSGNSLGGTLPPDWANMTLYSVNVSRNSLMGARDFAPAWRWGLADVPGAQASLWARPLWGVGRSARPLCVRLRDRPRPAHTFARAMCSLGHPEHNPLSSNFAGFLPQEWAAMPAGNGTELQLANNSLQGAIPDGWGARSSFWRNVSVAFNPAMCGALPPWFTARFNSSAPMTAGAQHGTAGSGWAFVALREVPLVFCSTEHHPRSSPALQAPSCHHPARRCPRRSPSLPPATTTAPTAWRS